MAGPRGRSWRTLFPLLALPLMLAPLALHLLMTEGYRAFLGKARTFYGNELYSFSYMGPHLLAFLRRFFALDPSAPFTGLLHLLGVLSFFWHIRSRRDCARYGLLVLVGVLAPLDRKSTRLNSSH